MRLTGSYTIYKPPKFVIAQTGRSGSGYTAKVLQEYGIDCGHEDYYRFLWKRPRDQYEGDSTWHIVRNLDKYEGIAFHQTRNPLMVLNSLYQTFKTSRSKAWRERCLMIPRLTGIRIRDIMTMIVCMNRKAARYSVVQWKVENMRPEIIEIICYHMGYEYDREKALNAITSVSNRYNTHYDNSDYFGWDDIADSKQKEQLQQQAQKYGYL